jgi:hypothetical protein
MRGKRSEARELLQPVYTAFGDWDDVRDMKEANALLANLELDNSSS